MRMPPSEGEAGYARAFRVIHDSQNHVSLKILHNGFPKIDVHRGEAAPKGRAAHDVHGHVAELAPDVELSALVGCAAEDGGQAVRPHVHLLGGDLQRGRVEHRQPAGFGAPVKVLAAKDEQQMSVLPPISMELSQGFRGI